MKLILSEIATDRSPATATTCRGFYTLVLDEGERRSLETHFIPSLMVKWFLLSNTDKAGAPISVFICVQDICLTFISQYFLLPQAFRCTHLRRGREKGFPWLLSQHRAGDGKHEFSASVSSLGAVCRPRAVIPN